MNKSIEIKGALKMQQQNIKNIGNQASMNYKIIFLLFAGHLMTDISQGIVPALLPYFISEYHLSYSAAGFLILALTVSSSIVQPIFGFLADRTSFPWFVAIGPLFAGLGIAVAGLFHQYYLIVAGIFLCGLGVAAFHPEGARLAGIAAGQKKASGMSIFSVGGNAGFALGPLIVAGLILIFGLKGIAFYLVPALVMSVILFKFVGNFSRITALENERNQNNTSGHTYLENDQLSDHWVPFILLTLALICRSILLQGFNTFLPSYWIEVFHASKEEASTVLAVLLGMGVVGNLVGGKLADRFGNQKTVFTAVLLFIPQLVLFNYLRNSLFATFLLMTMGLTIYITFSPTIVMGQQFLPRRAGFASGVTIGLAVSIGGFAAPILGKLADLAGVEAVFYLSVIFPVLIALFIFFIPRTLHRSAINSDNI